MSHRSGKQSADQPGSGDPTLRDVAHAHYPSNVGRWVAWIIVIAISLNFAWLVINNPNFEWSVVFKWFTATSILHGLSVTLGLAVVAMALGIIIGLLLAIARLSDNVLLKIIAKIYIWGFRGTPLLVQLLFWYNLSSLFPRLSLSIPFGATFASWNTNDLITPLTAAIVGLALNEAAFMAEIIRAGLISVDAKQMETALAFGMTRGNALRRIVIPQAMRAILPPTGNQIISMLKATSMVSVIAMGDLLYSVQAEYNKTFQVIPLLIVAVLWYLLMTSILNIGQSAIERYYARGDGSSGSLKNKQGTGPITLPEGLSLAVTNTGLSEK